MDRAGLVDALSRATPADTAAAHEEVADLVVVPMRHGSTVGHLLRDHADREILHRCPVPVRVVPVGGDRERTHPASQAAASGVAT